MRLTLLSTLFLLCAGAALAATDPLATRAEQSDFLATGDYEQTLTLMRALDERSPELHLEFFGHSAEGRAMPLMIASSDHAFTPEQAAASGKPIVLIQNGIHAGEIDGKDACSMLLRSVANGEADAWLAQVILLVVPIYNVDGHERISPYHRPNQDGPVEGMGFRTTTDGHDLNRDHLKLDTPEARAMIGLFNDWRPHLHVDNHVTNGSDHAWVLTYSWAEAPQIAPSLEGWLQLTMPGVAAATADAGHPVGPYVSLIDNRDPAAGFDSVVPEPRYATGYYPLRNVPSILVENHAHKPYRARVLANLQFMEQLLAAVAEAPEYLVAAGELARARTTSLGAPDAEPSDVVVRWSRAPADEIDFPLFAWRLEDSVVTGGQLLLFEPGKLQETRVPWIHRLQPELTLSRPRGYLIPPGWPQIEARLRGHALRVQRLTDDALLEVETLRAVEGERRRPASYQGHTRPALEITRSVERRVIPAGTLWIPADQPDFELAVQLLEAEAPDSLAAWGLLSIAMERKEYIGRDTLEAFARKQLTRPEVAVEWKRALEDETFRADGSARYLWWYRRTPYWDERVGLLPIFRLMRPLTVATEPWTESR